MSTKVSPKLKARILEVVTRVNALSDPKKKVDTKAEQLAVLIDKGQFETRFDKAIRLLFETALGEPIRPLVHSTVGKSGYRLGGMYVCTSSSNGHSYGDNAFLVVRSMKAHTEVLGVFVGSTGLLETGNDPHHDDYRKATKLEIELFMKRMRLVSVGNLELINKALAAA